MTFIASRKRCVKVAFSVDIKVLIKSLYHFTSEHYKVSKSEVFEKVIPAADFWISADDIMPKIGGYMLSYI